MVKNRFAALEGEFPDSSDEESDEGSILPASEVDTSPGDAALASTGICSTEQAVDAEAKEELAQVLVGGEQTDQLLQETEIYNERSVHKQQQQQHHDDRQVDAPSRSRRQARRRTASPKQLEAHSKSCSKDLSEPGDVVTMACPADQITVGSVAKDNLQENPAAPDVAAGEDNSGQTSKAAKKRAAKKSKKNVPADPEQAPAQEAPGNTAQNQMASTETPDGHQDTSNGPKLTEQQAQTLAELAVRLNEQNIANHLRATSSRRILLATPVDPLTISGDDILAVEQGDVLHCEIVDSQGWGFGTIVAPLRLAGTRGCFTSESMRPITAEVRTNRDGDSLEFTPGSWAEVAAAQDRSTKTRLREKAALNRIRVARDAWRKKSPC